MLNPKRKKNILLLITVTLVLAVTLCACGRTAETSTDSTSGTQAGETKITLYADFSAGSADAENLGLINTEEQTVSGDVTVEVLAERLSDWSGLDFELNDAKLSGDSATVDWAVNSTLVAGLDEREQKEGFRFYDNTSLNWFMLDSLAKTIKNNLKVSTVYYSMEGGKTLVLEDMPCLNELSVDQPYEGSAFFCAHNDNGGDDEEVYFTYRDEKNQLLFSYTNLFSANGVVDKSGTVRFAAQQGDAVLLYWVTPNTYKEDIAAFMERVTTEESQELGKNVVIGKREDLDQETGKVTPCAYYWVVDTDWIANVAIQCSNSEEASRWYDSLKADAVYIESVAGIDTGMGMSEDEAMDMLSVALTERLTDGTALVANGESDLNGTHCWTFSFGKNTAEKFTAEDHYAVTDYGKLYIMDIINNQYEPLTAR